MQRGKKVGGEVALRDRFPRPRSPGAFESMWRNVTSCNRCANSLVQDQDGHIGTRSRASAGHRPAVTNTCHTATLAKVLLKGGLAGGGKGVRPKGQLVMRTSARRHEVSRRHEGDQQDEPEVRAEKHAEWLWPLVLSPSRRRGKVLR